MERELDSNFSSHFFRTQFFASVLFCIPFFCCLHIASRIQQQRQQLQQQQLQQQQQQLQEQQQQLQREHQQLFEYQCLADYLQTYVFETEVKEEEAAPPQTKVEDHDDVRVKAAAGVEEVVVIIMAMVRQV